MMERAWQTVLERYGQTVELGRGEERHTVKAFFQPVEEKRPGAEPTPLGVAPRGKYLYLGPAEETLEGVEVLRWKGRAFVPLRQREMELGDRMVNRWGLFAES